MKKITILCFCVAMSNVHIAYANSFSSPLAKTEGLPAAMDRRQKSLEQNIVKFNALSERLGWDVTSSPPPLSEEQKMANLQELARRTKSIQQDLKLIRQLSRKIYGVEKNGLELSRYQLSPLYRYASRLDFTRPGVNLQLQSDKFLDGEFSKLDGLDLAPSNQS